MSRVQHEKSKKIKYEWNLSGNSNSGHGGPSYMHSRSLVSNDPPIKLNILSGRVDNTRLCVVISKIPEAPAIVKVEIMINKVLQNTVNVEGWTKDYVITDVEYNFYNNGCYQSPSIQCIITWIGWVDMVFPPRPSGLFKHTKVLLSTPDFSDFTIIVNDEEIPAHKVILAVQSPVFSAMFRTDLKESVSNRIHITDFDIGTMKKVVEYLYTGGLDKNLDVDALLPILAAADKYQIIELKDLCEEFLSKKIDINTALEILENASLYGVPQLMEKTVTFMVTNKKSIVQLDDFQDLLIRKPELFFEFIIRLIGE